MEYNLLIQNYEIYKDKNFINWLNTWQQRLSNNNNSKEKSLGLMKISNPVVIPRNHKVEEALDAAHKGDLKILNRLLSVLNKPYEINKNIEEYRTPSFNNEYQTFCGT